MMGAPKNNRNALITEPVKKLKVTEAAYLAGLIDGDGSIVTRITRSGSSTYRIAIGQKDPTILGWVKKTVGAGRIRKQEKVNSYKPLTFYTYLLCPKNQVVDLLGQLIPYLILKKDKAETILNKEVG